MSRADPCLPVNRLGRWYKPWWYTHVHTYLRRGMAGKEVIPCRDYLLRHNRAIFWVVADMIPFGNHWSFRWILGWLCPPKPAFLKFTTTAAIRKMTFTHQVCGVFSVKCKSAYICFWRVRRDWVEARWCPPTAALVSPHSSVGGQRARWLSLSAEFIDTQPLPACHFDTGVPGYYAAHDCVGAVNRRVRGGTSHPILVHPSPTYTYVRKLLLCARISHIVLNAPRGFAPVSS